MLELLFRHRLGANGGIDCEPGVNGATTVGPKFVQEIWFGQLGTFRLNDERRDKIGAPLPALMGRKLIRNDAADAFARMHQIERIVDVVERHRVGN